MVDRSWILGDMIGSAFVIDGGIPSQVANFLRNSPKFPRLNYFAIDENSIQPIGDLELYLGLREFFEGHGDTLTIVDIRGGSPHIRGQLERGLNLLPRSGMLRISHAMDIRTLLRGTFPELKCLDISFFDTKSYDFAISAPNLEICQIAENGRNFVGTRTVDLSDSPRLVTVSFSVAYDSRKLLFE